MNPIEYDELYRRNWPIISKETQTGIKNLKIAVAGCGSTGGAFIDGLLRLGAQSFHFCDIGTYELNNLNRQMVFLDNLGTNKAVVHSQRVISTNPHAKVRVWPSGITEKNLDEYLDGVDFLFDAVDVTTESGMKMKLALHQAAFKKKIPTGSALDLGYTQWLQSYNYHQDELLLKGKYSRALECKHPLKALIEGFSSVEELPYEITVEILRLIRNPNESACQLACVCFVLAGMVTPYMLYFIKKGRLPDLKTIDLTEHFEDQLERDQRKLNTATAHYELTEELRRLA